MSSTPNPFDSKVYDLGTAGIGESKQDIDSMLQRQYTSGSSSIPCIVCGQPAAYRLVAKRPEYNTAEVQDRGYACGHCCNMKYISPTQYSLRKLD